MKAAKFSLLFMLCLIIWFAALSTAGVQPVNAQGFVNVPIFIPPSPYTYSMSITNLSNEQADIGIVLIDIGTGLEIQQLQEMIGPGQNITFFGSQFDLDEGEFILARVSASISLSLLEIKTYSIGYDRQRFIDVGDGGNKFVLSPYNPITETPDAQAVTAAEPFSLTVNVGDTVNWIRVDGEHNVVADDGSFNSGEPSDTWLAFSYTFNEAGLFPYHCSAHGGPGGVGMSGIINVVGSDEPPTQSEVFLPTLLKPL